MSFISKRPQTTDPGQRKLKKISYQHRVNTSSEQRRDDSLKYRRGTPEGDSINSDASGSRRQPQISAASRARMPNSKDMGTLFNTSAFDKPEMMSTQDRLRSALGKHREKMDTWKEKL